MIPLVAPCITSHDKRYLVDRLDHGLLEDETELPRYEEAFAQTIGTNYAVAVCSGTAALTLSLRALGLAHYKINLPTYACTALLHATHAVNGHPDYIDTTYTIRTAHAVQADNADILVHLFGKPTYSRAPVSIEDITLSLGATHGLEHGTRLGVCSTHHTKMISTGRGGLVFGNDQELLQRIRKLAGYTTTYNGQAQYGYAMSTTQAALGTSQLNQLDTFIERRRELAAIYTQRFTTAGLECPGTTTNSVFFRYLIAVPDPAKAIELLADRGIECGRGVHPPLHQLTGQPDTQYPGATHAHQRLLSIPVHPSITDQQANWIAEQVVSVCAC